MRLDLDLPDGVTGHYAFRVGVRSLGGYEVIEEECALSGLSLDTGPNAHFHVRATGSVTSAPIAPRAMNDRLYLVNASGLPEFRPAYDALTRMGFYNINPDKVRDVQTVDAGALLARDGSNMTTILTRMWEEHPEARRRIEEYLEAIVPGIHRVEVRTFGPRQMLEFMQRGGESGKASWRLPATSVSDGTLRALGVLTALFQRGYNLDSAITLVGIEEPEAALHPAATGILFDSLREASQHTQVIVTSHSPELLDNEEVSTDDILAVVFEDGRTKIGPVDEVSRSVLRDRLFSAGELLWQRHLLPDDEAVAAGTRARLFEDAESA
jgi:hypothetical protein